MIHHNNDTPHTCDQIHCTTHTFDQLTGDHPVRQISVFRHFHRAENGHSDFTAADHAKARSAVEIRSLRLLGNGLFTCVDQVGVFGPLNRKRPHAQHAIL